MDDKTNIKINESIRGFAPYLGLGTQLAATMVLMFFVGWWLDGKFETLPLFTLVFSLLGAGAGLYNFIKTVLELNKKKKSETDN